MTERPQPLVRNTDKEIAFLEGFGLKVRLLDPIGAAILDANLAEDVNVDSQAIACIERLMAEQGFVVFKSDKQLGVKDFLRVSCWWGGRELHSTHSVHPATPEGNPHVFRLSNDPNQGIMGVGPQWHNDGSFITETFSHAGYHMVRPAEKGGGTLFAHQARAFEALGSEKKEYWSRLSSVNASTGVVHPLVHQHPLLGRNAVWLHLGMTGAVIEKIAGEDAFRLLNEDQLIELCHQYNDLLNFGLTGGYSIKYEYDANDCLFIDNLSVAHRAAPEAHSSPEIQGLRIMHRSTIKGVHHLSPGFGLPPFFDIYSPSPFGEGVWKSGGIGFRWDAQARMQN